MGQGCVELSRQHISTVPASSLSSLSHLTHSALL